MMVFACAVGPPVAVDLSEARDRDLVSRIGEGDEEAFGGLFRRYAPSARALALRVVRQGNLAEEIVQEAFLAVWRHPDSYEADRGSVKSWLMGMVHHRAVDLVRREEAHRRRAGGAIAEAAVHEPDPADLVADQIDLPQERAAVREALDELPPEQREVVDLMYFGGMSQTRISQHLGIPLGTVKSRTLLAMRRMKASLGGMQR